MAPVDPVAPDRILSKKAQEMLDVDEEVEEITHNAGRKGRKKEGGVERNDKDDEQEQEDVVEVEEDEQEEEGVEAPATASAKKGGRGLGTGSVGSKGSTTTKPGKSSNNVHSLVSSSSEEGEEEDDDDDGSENEGDDALGVDGKPSRARPLHVSSEVKIWMCDTCKS